MAEKPRFENFQSLGPHGFHRIAYTEWGDPRNRHVVVCVHGLTRNSRDFDYLAAQLANDCRVVCMDVVGRGDSDWLENKEDYGFTLYQADAAALLARISSPAAESGLGALLHRADPWEAHTIDWIGTSMGGLIGMILASKNNAPIRRLVLNDVGPLVPWPALFQLKNAHAWDSTPYASLAEVELALREACVAFGPLEDDQWRELARHGSRRTKDGNYILAYDPGIIGSTRRSSNAGVEFGHRIWSGVDLWPVWDAVRCPTLVLRGSESEVLAKTTAEQMQKRGPRARVVEFAGIGHAPWLMSDAQTRVVRDFIKAP